MFEFTTPGGRKFQIGWDGIALRLGAAVDTNNINTNAQWLTFLNTRFDATNASGLTAGTRSFLIEFFRAAVSFPS